MDYLQAQTIGSILRNTLGIYFRHCVTLILIVAVPKIPIDLIAIFFLTRSATETSLALEVLKFTIQFVTATFVSFPLTVAVSDICIGLKPSVQRAYRRAFANPGRVVGTYLAYTLLSLVAMLALFIPGLVVLAVYMFVPPVVILELRGGKAAFKRSRELGRGYYVRNLGIFFAIIVLASSLTMICLAVAIGIFAALMMDDVIAMLLVNQVFVIILSPLYGLPIVLLYYDMRARKEGYGAPQLMEDLRY